MPKIEDHMKKGRWGGFSGGDNFRHREFDNCISIIMLGEFVDVPKR